MTKLTAGYTAFKKPVLVSDPAFGNSDWDGWDNRRLRYNINWNYYQNAVYDETNRWSKAYKTRFGLNRYIRNLYNPSYRIGEFWQTHIWGGPALEFLTENDDIVLALAQVYAWSNWPIKKDLLTLYGAVMGDVGLRVRDDELREKVYFEVIHPSSIKEKTLDPQGNAKAYTLEENRANPNNPDKTVTYTEIARRKGDDVIIQTLLDGKPFAWNGESSELVQPYGFVPMIFIQNKDIGADWGQSELHAGQSKFREVDDMSSLVNDQIRKNVNAKWAFTGEEKPKSTPTLTKTQPTQATLAENPFPGREEIDALYFKDPNTKVIPMVADLDLAATLEHIKELMAQIELDYPELKLGIDRSGGGDISGKALRAARESVTTKVETRRANYDDALIRANMMALAIGGMRGYPLFESFSLDSFSQGDLAHTIKIRPVFIADPLDIAEIDQAQALAIKTEQEALKWPTVTAWRRKLEADGLSEEEIETTIDKALEDARQEDGFGFTEGA